MTASVIYPNCGNTIVLNLEPPIFGGFAECCCSCGATISVSYWNGNTPHLYYIRSSGGLKKR